MTREEAIDVLKYYPDQSQRLAEVYDDDEELREALGELFPNFEYPDFSYKTLREISSQFK